MLNNVRVALFGCGVLLFTGCMSPGTTIMEIDTQSLSTMRQTQSLTLAMDETRLEMVGVLETSPGNLNLAVLSGTGLVFFTIMVNADGAAIQRHPDVPDHLDPAWVLDDVALVNLDTQALEQALRGNVRLVDEAASRRVEHGNTVLVEIAYAPSRDHWHTSTLVRKDRGYELTVRQVPEPTVSENRQ